MTRVTRVALVAAVLGAVLVTGTRGTAVGAARGSAACPRRADEIGNPTADGAAPDLVRLALTLVDPTREASPDGRPDGSDDGRCRVLRTAITMPADVGTARPLILAVHGRDGDPTRLAPLLDTWARAGYVVAAPYFLTTDKDDRHQPTPASVARQTADARFVLDRVLALAADARSALFGRVDVDHIGAAGMSLGGMTVYGLVSHTCCRDARVDAAVVLAGVRRDFDPGRYISPRLPTLLVQGDRDTGYHNSDAAFRTLKAPKWFVTLHGSTHSPPFEAPRGPEAAIVDATTTAFWDRYLRGDVAAEQTILDTVNASAGLASLRYRA